jgi:polyhydroxyalkanoate synthesis regulator phasin
MLIRKGYKVKKIVEEMVNRYEIAPETAKKDVEQIIDELLELKLIIHA